MSQIGFDFLQHGTPIHPVDIDIDPWGHAAAARAWNGPQPGERAQFAVAFGTVEPVGQGRGEDFGHPGEGLQEDSLFAVGGSRRRGRRDLGPALLLPREMREDAGLSGQDLPALPASVECAVGPWVGGGGRRRHVAELLDLRRQDLGVQYLVLNAFELVVLESLVAGIQLASHFIVELQLVEESVVGADSWPFRPEVL